MESDVRIFSQPRLHLRGCGWTSCPAQRESVCPRAISLPCAERRGTRCRRVCGGIRRILHRYQYAGREQVRGAMSHMTAGSTRMAKLWSGTGPTRRPDRLPCRSRVISDASSEFTRRKVDQSTGHAGTPINRDVMLNTAGRERAKLRRFSR